MSYTDDIARPFAGAWSIRRRKAGLRSHRFNGFDWHAWGMQLRRYPSKPRPMKAIRLRWRMRHNDINRSPDAKA